MNTQAIVDNRADISLNQVENQNQFCTIWPSAKQGLELLQQLIRNPIAKGAISVVIAAGDAVSKTICG